MGAPMARRLLEAGFELAVYNRSRERAAALHAAGARLAASPAEAIRGADLAMTMLADDAAIEQVVWGGGKPDADRNAGLAPQDALLAGLAAGATHISLSTISLPLARRLAAAHGAAGQGFVSAPVFGRPDSAAGGKLWVLAAGKAMAVEQARPALETLGQGVLLVGEEPAMANAVKIAGNFTLAAMIEALGEAQALAAGAGVAPERLMDVLNRLYQSPVYRNYGDILAARRFEPAGFSLRLGLKDATLAQQAAAEAGLKLELPELIASHLRAALERGWGERDWSAFSQVAGEGISRA